MTHLFLLLLLLLAPLGSRALHAQSRALESITEADVRRRVNVIADDSMGGRATPSRGLEMTAQYIASEFKRFGLQAAGDSGSFIQRYPLARPLVDGRTSVTLKSGIVTVVTRATRDLVYLSGTRDGTPRKGSVLLLTAPSEAAARMLQAEGRIVLLAADGAAGASVDVLLPLLLERRPAGIIVVSGADSITFARQVAAQLRGGRAPAGASPAESAPVVSVHPGALGAVLQAAGIDAGQLRNDTRMVREIPMTAELRVNDAEGGIGAPNVAAILEGSDPQLRREYIVFSAHMDHVGTSAARGGADSIFNGADDDASGTAGVLELAEAYSRPGGRPKRSIIFLTVSGEERGLLGSRYFAANPPVPIEQIVANINMDMIGRNWRDTIVVIGKEHSDLGTTLARVNAANPGLGMTAIDDLWPEQSFYTRSDHYNFARRGVPVLFFFNGVHADYHKASDSPDKIDAEKEARLLRLIYLLGLEIGNTPERPRWNPESYKKVVR